VTNQAKVGQIVQIARLLDQKGKGFFRAFGSETVYSELVLQTVSSTQHHHSALRSIK
jgi:hypothetical protein